MTRQGKHHTVRSNLTGLTLLIITTKQSVTFYGTMYGKVQYRTPIPSHVQVKVNTVTFAGKGFVNPNIHDEIPYRFYNGRIMIIINNVYCTNRSSSPCDLFLYHDFDEDNEKEKVLNLSPVG